MSKRITDPDVPAGRLTRIKDVLPRPGELVAPAATTKVTLHLSKASVQFFKRQAVQCGTKYQKMIRALVDRYAERYSG